MIVKIHGTNGSGKSTLVREIMRVYKMRPEPGERPRQYSTLLLPGQPLEKRWETVRILGPYRTACGGMDALSSPDGVALVSQYTKVRESVVFFEGVLFSTTYGALGALSERSLVKWVYVFLDTPAEVCTARVLERRAAKGNDKPFDPERSLVPKIRAVGSVRRKAEAAGHLTYTVNHKDSPRVAVNKLLKFLEGV